MPSHGPPGDPHGTQNPWLPWFEDDPDLAYYAMRPQSGAPSFLDYWRQRGGQTWGDYQGALGQMMLRGQAPILTYPDFLKSYPFMQRYAQLGPEQRGDNPSRFAPGLRWFL